MRWLYSRVAHDAYPANACGQRVAELDSELCAVMIGQDDVHGIGGRGVDLASVLEAIRPAVPALNVRLDKNGAIPHVGAIAQQVARYRRGEYDGQNLALDGRGSGAVRDRATFVVDVARLPVLVVFCHDPSLPFVARGRQLAATQGTVSGRPPASGHNGAMRLSARNKINATVTSISRGEAIANVVLDAGGIRLVASITVEAAAELGLAAGTDVVAIVKASDVMVAVPD